MKNLRTMWVVYWTRARTFTSSFVGGKLVEIGPLGGKVGSVYEEFEDNVGSILG